MFLTAPPYPRRRPQALAGLLVPLVAAACGGSGSSPDGGAGAVDGSGRDVSTHPRDAGGGRTVVDGGASDASHQDAAGSADGRTGDASHVETGSGFADARADGGPCAMGVPSPTTAPVTLDTTCFTSTFDDEFLEYDISSGPVADGLHANERWFNGTDQCCMSPSNGWPGVMYPTAGMTSGMPVNPYSLLAGGGLQISLTESNNEWFSGVMTSVDKNGAGFAQAYGYFEMSAQLAPGTGVWPSFWMLSLPMGTAGGEIDVFEQLGCSPPLNPAVESIFHFTLHDWQHGTTPEAYTAQSLPDLTAAYHRYGLLWNDTYMALYFDGTLLESTATPSVMINTKYYLLADMGVGGGWVTTSTPNPSNLLIKHIRAYTVPGF